MDEQKPLPATPEVDPVPEMRDAGRLGRAAVVMSVNVLEPAISTPSSSAVTWLVTPLRNNVAVAVAFT